MNADGFIPENWVHLPGVECPDCMGFFLYAEAVDDTGAPVGEVRCLSCGYSALPATDVQAVDEDEQQDYCQQCGSMLDDDMPPYSHDVVRRPYVTASGDLYCDVCGSQIDQEEEDAIDADYFDDFYPVSYDMIEGETEERYIGEEPDGDDLGEGL